MEESLNFDTLSAVEYGNDDALQEFLFENGLQHKLFQETFMDVGVTVPVFPLMDAQVSNLDDWLLAHQVEHQSFAGLLGLNTPLICSMLTSIMSQISTIGWLVICTFTNKLCRP